MKIFALNKVGASGHLCYVHFYIVLFHSALSGWVHQPGENLYINDKKAQNWIHSLSPKIMLGPALGCFPETHLCSLLQLRQFEERRPE